MNIAVTGGAGFIGSHLVRAIAESGPDSRTYVYDDLSRGKKSNLTGVRCRLIDRDLVINRGFPVDFYNMPVVYHLAAKVTGIHYNMAHHYDMMVSNLKINTAVADGIVAVASRIKRVIWVSTACVYPHDAPIPTPEDGTADVCNPEPTNFGYGVAKWVGEQMALYLYKEYGVPVTIVRFFNAIGLRDYYDDEASHVTPALIKRVLRGDNPLVVWGTGKQTRVLVDATDIAKTLVMLAECDEAIGQIVNIGHEHEISIADLAVLISDIAHDRGYISCKPDIVFDTDKPNGYARRAPDTTKLRKLIGWVPDTPLYKSVEAMVDEYASSLNHHSSIRHNA